MSKKIIDRPEFREWVDRQESPNWDLMPLTHITKGINLVDIIRTKNMNPEKCGTLDEELNFFFYGRPAYRIDGDGVIKAEAACPTCLIFNPNLINRAEKIHAFDTGAFSKRLYKHILLDEMQINDFSLERDVSRPNRIIRRVFTDMSSYFEADTNNALKSEDGAESWEFHAKAYLDLINSPGRNEPDDRVCTIEVVIRGDVCITGDVLAIVVPHTLWNEAKRAPWLEASAQIGVEIIPYNFVPNRHPEYYHALLEGVIKAFYIKKGIL